MRMIDADVLLLQLSEYQLQESPGWVESGYGNADAYEAITNCIEAIEYAPTIDPVKRGRWVLNRQGNWSCSICGNDPYHDNMKHMNYCPNCGARMDEVEE